MPWNFSQQLELYGPAGTASPVSLVAAQCYCRDLAKSHYENFPVVTKLLPRELHQHFYNIYGYCRWADDLSDEVADAAQSLELLGWWREELQSCYAGMTTHPVYVALKETISQFAIPREPFLDLISAFEQDQTKSNYATFAELHDYCRRSANPVGRLVLYLMRSADETNFAYSDSVCTGLQLANFWQDVARDYEIGRVYLPREDFARFGYTEEMLAEKKSTPEFRALLEFQVSRARQFLLDGRPLIDRLPGKFQVDIELFIGGGLCILDKIEQLDFAVWEQRPKVGKRDLLPLLFKAFLKRWGRAVGVIRPVVAKNPMRQEATT